MRPTSILLLGAVAAAAAVYFLPDLLGQGLVSGTGGELDLAAGAGVGALGMAWMGGVLTSLTPCVYPLIPITMGVIGAREAKSRWKSLGLTTTYVLGMALMFSALGFAAASSGQAFGTVLANRWVLAGLALFFLVMASSMFGAFEIALPQSLARRLNQVGGAGAGGALAMGLVAGLVAAPCTGPVLASLLTFVASAGEPLFGVLLLFVYALGVGLPFFLIGAFSLSLPRSGPWMDGVKSVFGIALVAMALLYLKTAWPALGSVAAGSWALVLAPAGVAAGVLLGAVHRSWHGGAAERGLKAAGIGLAVLGLFLRLAAPAHAGELVAWVSDHDAALARAQAEGKPVMIDFYADWCAACKELDKYTYTDAKVAAEAERFVSLKIDGTVEDAAILELYERYAVQGLPTIVFIGSDGKVLEKPRVTGFVQAPAFLELMQQVR
ncbi:protein-disulfide reductase DsbD family protein [Vulgatibacter sp.]|uniref:protein-disulfide reductase DsbD family protein n=1 Tax=Vulgatibacter sp. TaxID=1971226 RepID=UPI003569F595